MFLYLRNVHLIITNMKSGDYERVLSVFRVLVLCYRYEHAMETNNWKEVRCD